MACCFEQETEREDCGGAVYAGGEKSRSVGVTPFEMVDVVTSVADCSSSRLKGGEVTVK